jgi:hypothetical protein
MAYDHYPCSSYLIFGSLHVLQKYRRMFCADHSNVHQNYDKVARAQLHNSCSRSGFLPQSQMSSTTSSLIQLMLSSLVSSMLVPKLVCPLTVCDS